MLKLLLCSPAAILLDPTYRTHLADRLKTDGDELIDFPKTQTSNDSKEADKAARRARRKKRRHEEDDEIWDQDEDDDQAEQTGYNRGTLAEASLLTPTAATAPETQPPHHQDRYPALGGLSDDLRPRMSTDHRPSY